MARRYVNPNRSAVPEPDLVDWIDERLADMRDGVRGPARGVVLDEIARRRAAVAARAPETYNPRAEGVKADGMFADPGAFVRAIWHRGEAGRAGASTPGRRMIRDAMSERVPSEGGFLLPEELRSTVMMGTLGSAVVRPRATVFPVAGYFLSIPQVDDEDHSAGTLPWLTATWVKPGDLIPESAGSFGRTRMEPLGLKSLIECPNELIEDSPAFQVWWDRAVPEGIGWYEDKSYIRGDGTSEPMGILNAGCTIPVTRAAASHISFADPPAMLARCLPASLERAVWLCSQSALNDMLSLYETIGSAPTSAAVPPSQWVRFRGGQWTLLGMPLLVTEHMSALGTAGDLALADWSFYVIADKQVMRMETSPHYRFADDITMLRVTHRANGRPWLHSPLQPEHGGQTVSPFVILN